MERSIEHVRSSDFFGKLSTDRLVRRKEHPALITSGKIKPGLLNIFENPTNSADIEHCQLHAQNIFGNTSYLAKRTSSKNSIF